MSTADNPYASPSESYPDPPARPTRPDAMKRLRQPGNVLIGFGIVIGLLALLDILLFTQAANSNREMEPRVFTILVFLHFYGSLAAAIIAIYGGVQLTRVRQYPACIAGAIAISVPFPYPCSFPFNLLGVVIGVWTLVALLRQDTRPAFSEPD